MRSIFFYFFLFLSGCNEAANNKGQKEDTLSSSQTIHLNKQANIAISEPLLQSGCYQQTLNRDTARLQLNLIDTVIRGILLYKPYERDANTGTFTGKLQDSLLLIEYAFQSEGTSSVRQIIFKIKDKMLFEAAGERTEHGTRSDYARPDQLQYDKLPPFLSVPCDQVNKKR